MGETKTTLEMRLITFLIALLLTPIFTPAYGIMGLIVAYILASAMGILYGCYIAKVRFKVDFDAKSIVKLYGISILSALPVVAILLIVSLPTFSVLFVGSLLYSFTFLTLMRSQAF